jgi:anti-sigma B factor antagonist
MTEKLFRTERVGNTLVVTPTSELSEFDFDPIQSGAEKVFAEFGDETVQNVVVDLERTAYFGSTGLGFFVRLWKRVKMAGGEMVFCGASPHVKEVLRVTRFDQVWPQRSNREQALQDLSSGTIESDGS